MSTSNVIPGGKSALSPVTIENSIVSPSQSNPIIRYAKKLSCLNVPMVPAATAGGPAIATG